MERTKRLAYQIGAPLLVLGTIACGGDTVASTSASSAGDETAATSGSTSEGSSATQTGTSSEVTEGPTSETIDGTTSVPTTTLDTTEGPTGPPVCGPDEDACVKVDMGQPDWGMCPIDLGITASVSGTTPLGSFTGEYAWHAFADHCNPTRLRIVVINDLETFIEDPYQLVEPQLVITSKSWPGESEVDVFMFQNGQTAMTTATMTFTLEDEDPPTFTGTISVQTEGWQIEGDFSARFCGYLTVVC